MSIVRTAVTSPAASKMASKRHPVDVDQDDGGQGAAGEYFSE
jgi:hypothetical protein